MLRRPSESTKPTPLALLRRGAVVAALKAEGARTVVDLGCGEGAPQVAAKRLRLERLPDSQRARIELAQLSASNAEVTLRRHPGRSLPYAASHSREQSS